MASALHPKQHIGFKYGNQPLQKMGVKAAYQSPLSILAKVGVLSIGHWYNLFYDLFPNEPFFFSINVSWWRKGTTVTLNLNQEELV